MDPINSSRDRFILLLQQRLSEKAAANRKSPSSRLTRSKSKPSAADLAAQSASYGADDEQLGRTLIEQLLIQRFGAKISNEARFQNIVSEVFTIITSDDDLGPLWQEVAREIRTNSA